MTYKYTNQNKVIFPELSYRIVGCLFNAFNNAGTGHREKYYQAVVREELAKEKIKFKEQAYFPLSYQGKKLGRDFLDFLIEDKIVLEIKTDRFYRKKHMEQILEYLKVTNLKLGIVANFTREGVKFYRILNN